MRKLAVLLLAISLCFCIQTTSKLSHSLNANLPDNFRADSYSLKIMGCQVNYTFTLDVLGNKTIVRFKDLKTTCENPMYVRLKRAITNAVLIDEGGEYYVFMPTVSNYVYRFKPLNSIVRYEGLPIVTMKTVVDSIKKAENVTYLGKKEVQFNNTSVSCDAYEYQLNDPLLGWVKVRVYVNNGIPIKAEIYIPKYKASIVTALKNMELGKAEDFNLTKYEIVERS